MLLLYILQICNLQKEIAKIPGKLFKARAGERRAQVIAESKDKGIKFICNGRRVSVKRLSD